MDIPFPLNTRLPFYGVDNERFKLGDVVYEALEDENDGYRSALGSVVVRDGDGIFFPNPVDEVEVVDAPERRPEDAAYDQPFDGWEVRSVVDGHIWLRFGTGNYDDYYPCFVFRYTPRAL